MSEVTENASASPENAYAPGPDATPLMKQFWELKSQAPDALLFFRMGDFYELFGEDAIEAARLLDVTLTSRDKGKANPLPMAGVPHHSVQGYIQKALDCGRKIAIADQVEDPEEAKKRGAKSIVRREITRIFTPAIQFANEGANTAYLACAIPVTSKSTPARWTLACVDASTGELRLSLPLEEAQLAEETQSLPIRHFLRFAHSLPESVKVGISARSEILFEELASNACSIEQARALVTAQYETASLDAFLESGTDADSATWATGVLLHYLRKTQKIDRLPHLRVPQPLRALKTLKLGPRTVAHLDLLPGQDGPGMAQNAPTLFGRINRTKSALGARQLKRFIAEPLKNPAEIRTRQDGVRELSLEPARLARVQSHFSELYDLERILARVITGLASPRDTYTLGKSLGLLPSLLSSLGGLKSPSLHALADRIRRAGIQTQELAAEILRTQREDAPFVARDGGVFNRGTTQELDRLIDLTENGQKWLVDLEKSEREATGIPSLKVRYNRVFGYYIEVTSAHLKSVPARYQRKQTTVGAERFFTDELKRFEDEIVSAEDRKKALEIELFRALIEKVRAHTPAIAEAADSLAHLDALASMGSLATDPGWCFPEIDAGLSLEISAGRHPLVDQGRGTFVPNDLRLGESSALSLLITGPNMGGKSTIMRQAAVIVILGQMGAPVPAQSARWGAVSSIYTRIGAHDAIARGQSTFMVEMTELAHILHHADNRSLVVLDEIGRGTSTYDGLSVAWSTLEWIARKIGCRTLFATHYHELTQLPATLPRVANAHMGVESKAGGLRFLYRLETGPANESFGIQVAKMAGVPQPVIGRAWKILEELERGKREPTLDALPLFASAAPSDATATESADPFFAANAAEESKTQAAASEKAHALIEILRGMELESMTPMQAMLKLAELRETAREPL